MGEVVISINEEGTLKVVQHDDLRVLLRRLRQEGLERHRVATWPNSSCWCITAPTTKFNRVLMTVFTFTLIFSLINLFLFARLSTHAGPFNWDYIFGRTWLFGFFEIGQTGIILLAMFAAVLTVGVLMKNVPQNAASARPRRVEVQTISARVQEV